MRIVIRFYVIIFDDVEQAVSERASVREGEVVGSGGRGWSLRVQSKPITTQEGDAKHAKRVFANLKTLTLKIVKTEILPNNKHKFILRVCEEANALELVIESKDDL
jgi:tRNA A-37 threonylcarbamoyl transferase component Bud32